MNLVNYCLQFQLYVPLWIILAVLSTSAEDGGDKDVTIVMPGVFPKQNDDYLNTAYRLPDDQTYFVTRFEPLASMKVIHHMIARGCEDAVETAPGLAYCNTAEKVLYAWARGAPALQLPDGVGFKVGLNSDVKFIVLQMHYGNASAVEAGGDRSGVKLHLTTKPLKKEAGVYLLATGGIMKPNTNESYEVSCEITDDMKFYPFAFRTHTHVHGKLVSGYKISTEGENKYQKHLIGQKNPQLPQFFYPVEDKGLFIKKGDILAASCLMENKENRTIYVGGTNNNEMCNFYIMYYYYAEETNHPPSGCSSAGPPFYYFVNDEKLKLIFEPK